MKKSLILSLILVSSFLSCRDTKKQIVQQETMSIEIKAPVVTETQVPKTPNIGLNYAVMTNLIFCENQNFTIRVDRLKNNNIRYISWSKPKAISDQPDLILCNGTMEKQGSGGGYHYVFQNGEWHYIIENNYMGETMEAMGIFLKLTKYGALVRRTKMVDLNK